MVRQLSALGASALILIILQTVCWAAETTETGNTRAEQTKVTLVEVQGNKRIEAATILDKVKTREGGAFSPAQIKEDIKTLYQLGHFEDVQVKTEGFEKGLKVIFSVKEKPLIREITFEGNEELTIEKLKEGLTLLPRSAFSIQLIQENADKIRLKYQDSGYYDAVVVPVITELRGGDRNVVFYIQEKDKVRLTDVVITGNNALTDDEIKAPLKTQEHWFFSFMGRSGSLRTEELAEDIETIRNLYYNKGFIQVQVDEPVIKPKITRHPRTQQPGEEDLELGASAATEEKNELAVIINIREGDQFRVGSITFKGNTILSDSELEKEIRLKKGDVFSREMLRQDVNRIMDRYDGIARPFAGVVPLFNIDPERKTVTINIEIQEGGEVRIGRIDITGNAKTRDKVIRREMRLNEGDLYSKKAIRRSYERINNLNFFETVDIAPERRLQEPVMDLNVKVREKMTGTLSVGGGYSSIDRLVGIAEVTQGNLAGRGQLLKFKTQWGGKHRILMLSFMEPYILDEPVWGRVDVYRQTQLYDGYTLDSNGFALGLGKTFDEFLSGSIRYSLDSSGVKEVDETNRTPYVLEQQLKYYGTAVTTSALTASLTRDSRDFYLDPRTGSKNSIFIEYAGGPLGGDPQFIKSVADSAWYYPLFWDTVFMARARIGTIRSLIDKPVPISERFFVGGSSTVRGFRYGTAGPVDSSLNRVGGNKELIFNLEYNFPLVTAARLKGVIFYDMGRAFADDILRSQIDDALADDPRRISFRDLKQGWGWGFWWLSPLGPLRFEWGYIINQKAEDQASKFEFNIGTLF